MVELQLEGLPDPLAAEKAWQEYTSRHNSIITDIFQVQSVFVPSWPPTHPPLPGPVPKRYSLQNLRLRVGQFLALHVSDGAIGSWQLDILESVLEGAHAH